MLTFHYVNATGPHTFDVDLGQSAVRLASIGSGFVSRAELGQTGTGALEVDDPGGALDLLGLQYVRVRETLCAAGSDIVWYGYIGDQQVTRGDSSRPSLVVGADRVWTLDLNDFNSILQLRRVGSFSRPAETAGARLTALLALSNCPVHDNGYVTYPGHAMDANDYTDSAFADVLADIQAAVAYNFWADYDQSAGNIGLWFLSPTSSAWSTTARISNVLGDVDGTTTFEVRQSPAASLRRSPSRIASSVRLRYASGRVVVSNSATSDKFAIVDQVAPQASVKTAAKATAVANQFLLQADAQDERISCTVRVPAAHVNDIRAGHLMSVRFSHFPGFEDFTPCRVMMRAVLQDEETDQFYNVALELTPQAAGGKRAFAFLAHRDATAPLNMVAGGSVVSLASQGWSVLAHPTGGHNNNNAGIYILAGPGTAGSPQVAQFAVTGAGNFLWLIGSQISELATGGEVAATAVQTDYLLSRSVTITTTGPGLVLAAIRIENFDSGTRTLTPPAGTLQIVDTGPNDTFTNPNRDYGRMSVVAGTVPSAGTYTYTWVMSNEFDWASVQAAVFIPSLGTPADLQNTPLVQVPPDAETISFPHPM